MVLFYRILADVIVLAHVGYVAFVILGQLAIVAGGLLHWSWIRNLTFRVAHLTAIAIVMIESWLGIPCPLTTWEKRLTEMAGDAAYEGDFVANCLDGMLFYQAPRWVFTACYTGFAALVLLTFLLAPPRFRAKEPLKVR